MSSTLPLHSSTSTPTPWQQFQKQIVPYLKRMLNPKSMDWEIAYNQMLELLYSPSRVFKSAKNRKVIKNYYARDDPAFVFILAALMMAVGLAYAIMFHSTFVQYLSLTLSFFFVDFLLVGIVVSSVANFIANRYLRSSNNSAESEYVEWLFSFDIHCNSFFPSIFMGLYVGQLLGMPVLKSSSFFVTIIANTAYLFAFVYYFYVTFRGYSEMQFLDQEKLLSVTVYPVLLLILGYILITFVVRFNITRFIIYLYFDVPY